MSAHAVCVLTLCLAVGLPAAAVANEWPVMLRIQGALGFGGTIDTTLSSDAVGGDEQYRATETDDLEASYGGGLQVEIPVGQGFAVGAGVQVLSWATTFSQDLDLERNRFLDFDAIVRWAYPVGASVSLYGIAPAGISVSSYSDGAQRAIGARLGHGYGVHASARVGAEYMRDGSGVFVELGAVYRWARHQTSGELLGTPTAIDLDASMAQFVVRLGFAFGL